jgi:hypothetical protein
MAIPDPTLAKSQKNTEMNWIAFFVWGSSTWSLSSSDAMIVKAALAALVNSSTLVSMMTGNK